MSGIVGLPGSKSGLIDSGGTIGAGIGKYTPVISRVGSAPSGSPPANQMIGLYRTFGDVCFVNIQVTYNGFSGGSGQWYVAGYRGASAYDAGLFYCPYVPLQMVRAIGENDFQPKIAFKTRYGMAENPFARSSIPTNIDVNALAPSANVYYRRARVNNIM